MIDIDNSYRIGRCNYCERRTVWAWPAASGLRLDDVRCPRCNSPLDRTSRMAYRIVTLTDEQIVDQRDRAIVRTRTHIADRVAEQTAWLLEHTDAGDFRASLLDRGIAELDKNLARLEKAAAKAAA